jgi:hypothetical protein
MADGTTKPKISGSRPAPVSGGRPDSKPETKKAKTFHPNPENEDDINSRWGRRKA